MQEHKSLEIKAPVLQKDTDRLQSPVGWDPCLCNMFVFAGQREEWIIDMSLGTV